MKLRGWLWLAGVILVTGCVTEGQPVKKEGDPREAARIHTQMGIEYLRKGDVELARGKLEKAVELDPKNAEAQGAIALLYANTGEVSKAEKHYEKSLALQPDDGTVLNNYGVMQCSQGKYEKADLQFRRAALNPHYGTPEVALTNAGVCARKIKDDVKAETYLREALKANPNFVDALGQMALISADQARYLNARGFLQRYQNLQAPMTPEMLMLGVRVELALGDRKAAQRYAQTLRTEHPDAAYEGRTGEYGSQMPNETASP